MATCRHLLRRLVPHGLGPALLLRLSFQHGRSEVRCDELPYLQFVCVAWLTFSSSLVSSVTAVLAAVGSHGRALLRRRLHHSRCTCTAAIGFVGRCRMVRSVRCASHAYQLGIGGRFCRSRSGAVARGVCPRGSGRGSCTGGSLCVSCFCRLLAVSSAQISVTWLEQVKHFVFPLPAVSARWRSRRTKLHFYKEFPNW